VAFEAGYFNTPAASAEPNATAKHPKMATGRENSFMSGDPLVGNRKRTFSLASNGSAFALESGHSGKPATTCTCARRWADQRLAVTVVTGNPKRRSTC